MKVSTEVTMKERYLALVLLDIIGSTAFVQRNGAQVAAQWFQVHDRLTRSLVYRYEGREIDRSDGFLLSFNKTIDAVNITKPKRGRKAGVTIATTPAKTVKENDELKDLIDENDDSTVQSEDDDNDNLAEDISIDISKDKSDD